MRQNQAIIQPISLFGMCFTVIRLLVASRLCLVARWLVARRSLGGELVGGETPWWQDDRIPSIPIRTVKPLNQLP